MKTIICMVSICLFFLAGPAWAETPAGISAGGLQVLTDRGAELSLRQVLSQKNNFSNVHEKTPNYYYSSSAYWFRIPVKNNLAENKQLYLDVLFPTLDHVKLYVVRTKGDFNIQDSGDRMPASSRPFPEATSLILPFELAVGESVDLYVRVQGDAQVLLFPFQIRDQDGLRASLLMERLIHGMMIGIVLLLFSYNLLLYIILREPSRLYYLAYLPFAFLAFTAIDGFGPTVLYPSNTWLGNEGMIFFQGASVIFSVLFTRVFLYKKDNIHLGRWIKAFIGAGILMILSSIFLPVRFSYQFGLAMLFTVSLVLMIFSINAWRHGQTEVRFFVLAQSITWIGSLLFALMIIGVLPFHILLLESISIGVCAGALLHSLAIADRIRILQKQNIFAEETAHRNLKLRREELERLVSQRTSELENARRQAELQATTDILTGIYNRRGLLKAAKSVIGQTMRYDWPLSVAMLDIDHFKLINDQYGHPEGDRVLRDIAQTVTTGIRGMDIFGRVGGEEFLLIMPNTTIDKAADLSDRLRVAIAEHVFVGSPPQPVTASFGVACLTDELNNTDALIKASDDALYRAKQNGRNRVEIHEATTAVH